MVRVVGESSKVPSGYLSVLIWPAWSGCVAKRDVLGLTFYLRNQASSRPSLHDSILDPLTELWELSQRVVSTANCES